MKRWNNKQHEQREHHNRMTFKDWIHEGMEVEREHTRSRKLQRKIALDHLKEHPLYYRELKKMERKLKRLPRSTHSQHSVKRHQRARRRLHLHKARTRKYC